MGKTRSRRGSLLSLLITEVVRETQYGNSMFFVRIFIKVTSRNLILEKGYQLTLSRSTLMMFCNPGGYFRVARGVYLSEEVAILLSLQTLKGSK
jgi:hypothetical protein